jgi:hypothetical protein
MKPACRKSSSIGQHKWRTVPSGTSPHRGLQSISDSVCPVHDFCLYCSVPNWVCKGGMPSTCKEIKQLERPRLALFICSLRKKQLRCFPQIQQHWAARTEDISIWNLSHVAEGFTDCHDITCARPLCLYAHGHLESSPVKRLLTFIEKRMPALRRR